MEQQKKKRGQNWSAEEKEMLRQLISQSAAIIENKNTNTTANLLKAKEWRNITNKLNELCGKTRSNDEIKLAWKRMKLAAKANLSAHRQQQCRTGGGEKPKSPSPEDLLIMSIAPHDFVTETNDYDSDAVHIVVGNESDKDVSFTPEPSTSTEYASPKIIDTLIEVTPHPNAVIAEDAPKVIQITKSTPSRTSSRRKGSQNKRISETLQESIVNSNVEFKKKHLQMLEAEHNYKIQIYKLKSRKLELEIALLENKKNSNTNE